MTIKIMNEVWTSSKSEGRARLVLLAIADQQGELGAWPSIATLAKRANASQRSIKRDLAELENLGELIIERQAGEGFAQYKTNRYWVNLPGVTDWVTGVTDGATGVTAQVNGGDSSGKLGVTTSGTQTLSRTLKETGGKTAPKPVKENGTKIPHDFKPSQKSWDEMATHFTWVDLKLETHAFKDHWNSTTKAATKKNWDLTWKNWIRQEAKWSKGKQGAPVKKHKFTGGN